MEGQTITMQDIFLFDYSAGVDRDGRFLGRSVPTGVRPQFTDRFEELGIQLSPRVFGTADAVDGTGDGLRFATARGRPRCCVGLAVVAVIDAVR